jgi:hypothetical protein
MSTFFEGSAVLTQNSGGHGFSNIPSKCTFGHVKAYLDSGILPKDGTVCETDVKPLVNNVKKRDFVMPRRRMLSRRRI